MREAFHHSLERLADGLVEMAALVVQSIELANLSLKNNDIETAQKVIEADIAIDNLQLQLDKQAIDIMATQSPVASDLRAVVASLRMSASLERMGDLARHISQAVRIRYPEPVVPDSMRDTFAKMGASAEKIARALHQLLAEPGLEQVPQINNLDEDLDELHLQVFGYIASKENLRPVTVADVTLTSRYYERFGDHAVSVAQKVDYLLSGESWDAKVEGASRKG